MIRGAKNFDKFNLRTETDERMEIIMTIAEEDKLKEVEGPALVKRK